MEDSTIRSRKSRKDKHEDTKESIEDVPIREFLPNSGNDQTQLTRSHSRHSRHKVSQQKQELKKKLYQSRRVTFILGAIIGLLATIVITAMLSEDIKSELDRLISFDSINVFLDDWKGALPLSLQQMIETDDKSKNELRGSAQSFSVGRRMAKMYDMSDMYNVVMVPGVISTGIESWGLSEDSECPSTPHFRKRLWGSFYMLRTMVLDKACWLKHIMLDTETGLDPPGIKLRASLGFDAADFFVAGYWIWNKILQNLAVIGYGPNNMISAAYDWRLAYLDLERRDGYFSKLKGQVETTYKLNGQKSYLVGHSMGVQIIIYFMKWVEAEGELYGNGGKDWCSKYLAGIVNISGTVLGTPKAIPALMSGEMKDTVQLNQLAVYGLEKFFSKKERVEMLRTFGGVPSMIPKGGDAIWGNLTQSPDDRTNQPHSNDSDVSVEDFKNETFGPFIRYHARKSNASSITGIDDDSKDFTMTESIEVLFKESPDWFAKRVKEQYSFGIAKTSEELEVNNQDHSKWSNPLEITLPNAPDMKIFCFYGVGNPTERAYTYKEDDTNSGLPFVIDTESKNPVFFGDGDGTVSLMTHTMCHEWQKEGTRFNPSNIQVKVVEIMHEPDRFDIRGGAKTAEHVDILGSAELNELVLKVVSGHDDLINNTYVSELHDIAASLDL